MIFLQQGLALKQRQPPEVVAVEVKQIECDHHDLFGMALEFVLQHQEVRGAVVCRDHHLAINDRRYPAPMCQASAAIFRKRLVQSLPRRVSTLTAASLRWT